MKIPVRNVYYQLCYAWSHFEETDLVEAGSLERLDRVQDLLAKVLSEGTFRLIRRGIARGYHEITREIPGVRGKLQVGAMATTAVRSRSRAICTFEEFSADVLHNQILRSTLDTLLRNEDLDPSIRRDVALAHQKLEGIRIIRVSRGLFRRVQLHRNQRHYRFLLQICQLVHESLLVDEQTGGLRFQDFRRDKKQMWRLFEDFAREFYRHEQGEYRVLRERLVPWDGLSGRAPTDEAYIPEMYSDILLEAPTRRIILDTKFYRNPLSRRWGSEKLRSGNLYQLLAYLENRQGSFPSGPRHEGVLLYAAVDRSFRIEVTLRGFRIQARTVDLNRSWQEIRRELLEVLGQSDERGFVAATRAADLGADLHREQGLIDDFVRVERGPTQTVILVRRIEWNGPHSPVASWHRVASLPANAKGSVVAEAVRTVLHDREFFRVCETCGERNPLGWMQRSALCQGCAQQHEGVVY